MVLILQKHNAHYTGQRMCINAITQTAKRLTFTEPMFAHVKVHKKSPGEIHHVHLGNDEIYCIVKTWWIISVLFSTNYHLFQNFTFLC